MQILVSLYLSELTAVLGIDLGMRYATICRCQMQPISGEVETMAALMAAASIAGLKWSGHYFPDDRKAESWLWVNEPFNLKHFS